MESGSNCGNGGNELSMADHLPDHRTAPSPLVSPSEQCDSVASSTTTSLADINQNIINNPLNVSTFTSTDDSKRQQKSGECS